MRYSDTVKNIAQSTGLTADQVKNVIDGLASEVGSLTAGENVRTPVGTFKRKAVPERTHRNPKTGAAVIKGAHEILTLRAVCE